MRFGKSANILCSILMITLAFFIVLPVILVIILSFSSEQSIAENGYRVIPSSFSLDAYRYIAMNIKDLLLSFGVTLFITVTGSALSLFLISTMAFVLSRKEFKLASFYTVLILIPLFFGGGLAASYAVNTQLLGLKNSILAMILPGACSSWYILVMRTYFKENIPGEVLEAAEMDGASVFRIFWQFVLPMSTPILVTVGLFEAFAYWNTWYEALLYIDTGHSFLYPLQYLLYTMQMRAEFASSGENVSGAVLKQIPTESFRMALVVIIIAPVLLSYPFFQKFFIKGLTSGIGK